VSAAAPSPDVSTAALRVGLVVGGFPKISETFVINQAAGLIDRGVNVDILALNETQGATGPTHDTVAAYDLEGRTYRPSLGPVLVSPFADQGWHPAKRGSAFLAQALTFARRPRYDVIHCQFASLGLQILQHARLGTLRYDRLVLHVRGSDVSSYVRERGADLYRELFARADLLIANCDHFRQRAVDLGAPEDRIIVIGSAVETDRFALKPFEENDRPPRLVSIGRLVEKKGFEYAIRAAVAAARRHEGLTYEIIGEGELRPDFERLIAELDAGGIVTLAGALPHGEIARRLAAADIIVAPSVTAASGDQDAPVNSLKEGMATGLVALATAHGGIPELVEDGVNGKLVPERDAEALAAGIDALMARREDWPEMGRRGRAKVVETYDREVVTDRQLAAYRRMMHSGRQ
jgi:colanic acid/amylovoran biosynthesis glycosyltransferase